MLQEYLRRIGLLLVGLLVSAIGITLMLQANIGLEPWSVLQQGIAKTFGITYGTAASIVGAAVIAIAYFAGRVSASVRWQIFSSARYSSTSCCT